MLKDICHITSKRLIHYYGTHQLMLEEEGGTKLTEVRRQKVGRILGNLGSMQDYILTYSRL